MPPLARRNLFHDRVRLAVTLTGIAFAVVLIIMEGGFFVGFSTSTTSLVENSKVDLWVTSRHVPYVELGAPFNERKLYQVRAIPGVEHADKFINRWTEWKRPDGRRESVQVVGFNENTQFGGPWNISQGSVADLKTPDGIIVDEFYKEKLGVKQIGDTFEIAGKRARVVGFTNGIRAFTTSPYVFTTFKRAQDYTRVDRDEAIYVLVKVAPGWDLEQVRRNILDRVRDVEVYTTPQFASMTRNYWMFTTGAGIGVLIAAALGLIVGFVVVAQTIYATTMDHLREFGTLKAMGAPNSYVYKVILQQAVISAIIGFVLGCLMAIPVVGGAQRGGAAISVPWPMMVGVFIVTVLMCMGASMVSIHKVTRIDPAMVFKQ